MRDCGRVEVRHQIGGRWVSGVFDDLPALRSVVAGLVKIDGSNVFSSLNGVKPMHASNDMTGRALRDADFGWHMRLPFDFDPVRGTGQPSTDDELAMATAERNRLVRGLRALGWPMPATAVSGNGAHAVFRCRLPVSAETSAMLRAVYAGLRAEFSTEQVLFDPTVRNPSRIWRLYGTTNRKGEATAERPHRLAAVLIPDRWDIVSPQAVERLAAAYARSSTPAPASSPGRAARPAGRGDFRTLDVRAWFTAHGAFRRTLGAGKHAVVCPWTHEHSSETGPLDTSTVVWEAEPGLWPSFHCSHAHCAGRSIREVMARWGDADHYCAAEWRREAAR